MTGFRSIFAPGLLQGQAVVVTGGGSGIGRCTAHALASLGAAVAIVGRRIDRLEAVRHEIEAAGGSVNAVAPGWIASSGLDRYPPEMQATLRSLPELVPLRRLGTESEVSAAIVFLLSPAAAFVSGACLRVDRAAPNAKRIWPEVGSGATTVPFDGFHLASTPRVLGER